MQRNHKKSLSNNKTPFFFLLVTVAGVIFLLWYSLYLPIPSDKQSLIFYSNQTRHDLKLLYCKAIAKASTGLYVATFGLSDPQICRWLQKKSQEGTHLTICCKNKESKNYRKKFGPYCKIEEIRGSGLSHEKIMIINESCILLGSTNLTTTSLVMHDNLVIGMHSKKLAKKILHRQKGDSIRETIANTQLDLYFLPEKHSRCLSRILSHIDLARSEIKLAMFTLTHPKILEALRNAQQRGVNVQVIIDRYSAASSCVKPVQYLRNHAIEVRQSHQMKLMHHKWALIDQQFFITGSANWTQAAFNKNRDYVLFFSDLLKEQKAVLKSIWKQLYLESDKIVI